ncbi:copper-binding protein [Rhodobacterales bacterium 59_46_T64]|nr:copper-binding protein [Rhodobacterales bacterium 59_46_T64]
MSFKPSVFAGAVALSLSVFALPAWADGIMVKDPYARASASMSTSGAAFMMIENVTGADDQLTDVRSEAAERTELHTHEEDENGVMRMLHVEAGFAVPAGETLKMQRGGHHVMFLGLKQPMVQGKIIPVTLVFENAGEVTVEVPVDLERKPMHGMSHGKMDHSKMKP